MTRKSLSADEKAYNRAFGARLEGFVAQACSRDCETIAELHGKIFRALPRKSAPFKRWYSGQVPPSLYLLSKVLGVLDEENFAGYDLRHLLLGKEAELAPDEQLRNDVSEILERVHFLTDVVQDSGLGLEGVVMRQSVRMLEDLRRGRELQKVYRGPGSKWSESEGAVGAQAGHEHAFEPLVAGILTDDLVELVERCSTCTRLATLRLSGGQRPHGRGVRSRPDRFRRLVMNNLRENGRYEILLPPDGTNWEVVANQYKQSLAAGDLRLPRINTYMKFRVSPYVFGAGYCIMELDLRKLLKKREMLAQELLCDYIGQVHDLGNGKVEIGEPDPVKSEQVSSLSDKRYLLGTVLSPSTKMNGVSLMDRHRLALAMDAWADSWRPDGEVA